MDPIIANAPIQQFARKAHFWRYVNILRNQTNLPSHVGYRYFNARELEAEYIRLKRRQTQQNIARQAVQVNQQRQQRIIRQEQLNNVQRFFMNPLADAELNITNIPIREVIPNIVLRPGFSLLLNAEETYWTVNTNNMDRIINDLNAEVLEIKEMGGSDAQIINVINNPNIQVKFIWRRAGRQRPNGGYLKYYNKLDKVDLSRYGIYRNADETNEYKLNCLEIALINGGITQDKVDKVKTMIRTRYVPQKDLKKVAKQLNIYIVLCSLNNHKDNLYYGNKQDPKINLGLIDEHYFLIEKTNYTSFCINNYFEVCPFKGIPLNEEKDFNKIYKKESKKFKRIENRFINSYDIVKILLAKKETHLQEINMTNCGTFSQYSNRSFEYTILPEINESEAKLCEPNQLMKPKIFLDKYDFKTGISTYHPYEFLYFDFESITDFEYKEEEEVKTRHEQYMICSETRTGQKKCFIGYSCALKWLQSLDKNYVCIAHNLRYDLQFLIKYLNNVSDMIKTGNKIKSISGEFYNRNTGKTIKLHFKDSYGIITMPLKKFGKCFNLNVKKEVMPYEIYNKNTINKTLIDYKEAEQHLSESNYTEFIKNINEWKLVQGNKFNHIEYARIYCEMDVQVLKKGYEIFRGWMQEVCNLDIDNAVSIPQLANTYGLNRNVFKGCYKISGVARDFIQKCVVGGRCMTRKNKQFKINHDVDDFDGVSLYPSAMHRMAGFLKGKPKVWNSGIDLSKVDGYFIEIEVEDIKVKRDFPLLSRKNDEGIRIFSNDIRGTGIFVDKTSLEDLVKFQGLKYKILRGYYFNEGRNITIQAFMKELFEERLKKKSEKNPIQEVYKLIMNAFYGKLIMKPIDTNHSFIYGKDKMNEHLSYRFNSIIDYVKITEGMYIVKESRSIMEHFSMPHCGAEVLSMSKRIMNEVMCLAEDMGIEIYYQDTDSMHIDARLDKNGKSGVDKLSAAFKKMYGKELVGKNLGQFHSDFDFKSDVQPISVESVYLGKKAYCDKVKVVNQGIVDYMYHARMKGIPGECVEEEAKKNYNQNIISMYDDMLNHKQIIFDLIQFCKFKSENNFTTTNHKEFKRSILF